MRSLSQIKPIILAAGDSSRMGFPKALLPMGEDLFITRIIRLIAKKGLPDPIVVLGRAAEQITKEVPASIREIYVNPDPDRGQLSSIQIAFSHVPESCDAAMIWPVDQPNISEELLGKIISGFVTSEALIAYPKNGNRRGHPAVFHRSLFQEFMETPLSEGPKNILIRHQPDAIEIPASESGCIVDIDTPAEYEALMGVSLDSALKRIRK